MNPIESFMTIPQIAKLLPTDAAMHACAVAGKFDGDDRICLVALLHDVASIIADIVRIVVSFFICVFR